MEIYSVTNIANCIVYNQTFLMKCVECDEENNYFLNQGENNSSCYFCNTTNGFFVKDAGQGKRCHSCSKINCTVCHMDNCTSCAEGNYYLPLNYSCANHCNTSDGLYIEDIVGENSLCRLCS